MPATALNIDWLNIAAFDAQNPHRNKNEADFPAPLYLPADRNPEMNIDYQVTDLIARGFPANKIVVGIPTFGRAWEIKEGATATGVPPITAEGAAAEGVQTKHQGTLAYAEICSKLLTTENKDHKGDQAPLRKVGDPTKRYGTYAFRLPDSTGKFGMWVGYEDPDTAGNKAAYVRAKSLGGVGIFDLSTDDFRGACSGDKFPILRAARYRLM